MQGPSHPQQQLGLEQHRAWVVLGTREEAPMAVVLCAWTRAGGALLLHPFPGAGLLCGALAVQAQWAAGGHGHRAVRSQLMQLGPPELPGSQVAG